MKIRFPALTALFTAAGIAFIAAPASAQDVSAPPVSTTAAPRLDYGTSQILQMVRANVNDDTLIAYIKNSGNSYTLNADQIIYLRQQGVSDAVITTMLNQPKVGLVALTAPAASSPPASTTATPAVADPTPTVTYVQTVPTTTYYYYPYYDYAPAYYPYYHGYGCYPSVSFSFGWGGHWGGGWHGGWHGGYGGGWHGHW